VPSYQLNAAVSTFKVGKKASSTWSAAAGTVDINAWMLNIDGAPGAGSDTVDISIGCWAGSGGSLTYGAASTVTWTPPALNKMVLISATPALPGACAAGTLIYVKFSGGGNGGTGVEPRLHMVEMVIRGN
jgi:hypothetical protein